MDNIDISALEVTITGVASFGVLQASRVMVDWLKELIEPQTPIRTRRIVTVVVLLNVILWALAVAQPDITVSAQEIPLGLVAAWSMLVMYLTAIVSWTVNSFHVKEKHKE